MKKTVILDINQFKDADSIEELSASTLSYHLQHHHAKIVNPHKHNFFVTVLFTQGTGIHEIDFERFDVKRGSIFMLNPGQTHYWELSEDIEGYIFFHSENFYNLAFTHNSLFGFPFFYSTKNSPWLQLSEQQTISISRIFEEIIQEYTHKYEYKYKKIILLIDLLYIEIARWYEQEYKHSLDQLHPFSDKINQLEILIDQHYKTEKSPSQYAQWMNISPKHLNRIIQNSLNKTTTQLITERVILEAKRLIAQPSLQLTTISELLGYEEYAYFSRLFKKQTSETPTSFRSRYSI